MKKWAVLLILLAVAVLSFVIISMARPNATLPRVQDKALGSSSAFGDFSKTSVSEKDSQSKSQAKGSNDLKLTGPVYDLDTK